MIESVEQTQFINKTFINLLNNKNNKRYARNTCIGAVFAERFNLTIRDLLKKPVFESGDATWIGVLPTITKQYNKGRHSFTKLTPIEAFYLFEKY